ncbi:MAG: ATP-binding cassette domain-containing protein [Bacteroidales bacterium OttesenSCG-928-I14]|jgi:molybdate transport system ATP-binding protein|nr:ATP-binding cassette domain-containing protein [Bacteroidales bacterium OttesenSCG-928-I14]
MIYINVERKIFTSDGNRKLSLNIRIPDKGLIFLIGKSGVGKTTILRMIAGLLKPDRGIIRINNITVFDSFNKINISPQKRNISFMFQDYVLFPNMTVEENIFFAQKKKDIKFINQLMKIFELESFRNQKPENLSGGQKQRVALARSLAKKSTILLLDEPFSALDEVIKKTIRKLILKIHHMFDVTTLIVSHDKKEIKQMSDYILYIGDYCEIVKN